MSEVYTYTPDWQVSPKWGNKRDVNKPYPSYPVMGPPYDFPAGPLTSTITTKLYPDGGPSTYYDLPEGTNTLNDIIENRSYNWLQYSFHLSNIFKACFRWGTKSGTTIEYDARKIIYSGCRLLKMIAGPDALRKELQRLLDDNQFKGKQDD